MKPLFEMLAGYNAWANERIYDAAAALSDADYRADHGGFFGSVHGTLNHLLVGDRIWMRRLTGEGPSPTQLDAILYEDFGDLRAACAAEDARIIAYVASLTPADLAGRCATARSAIRQISSKCFRSRWCMCSTIRPIIAARCMVC
jgi:uncharacterized damage-inducible protein DinB